MSKRILLIVEGPNDEKILVKKLWDRFDKKVDYTIVTYETNIYVLMRKLFKEGIVDEDLDLLRLLKSQDVPDDKRLKKDEKFTDIYLIFDLDPHDPHADFDMLKKMLTFFDDSSSKGKLFINYPMMQSYRHITGEGDSDFKDRIVPIDLGKRYKSLVDKEAWNRLKQINRMDRGLFRQIIEMHLSKLNYLVNNSYHIPTYQEYVSATGDKILDIQLKFIEEKRSISVLNTSIFLIVDYRPSWFFNDVKLNS